MKCAVVCTNGMAQMSAPPPLTICDLQLSLGEDAACDGQGLADIVTGVSPLHGRNGEVAAGRHREATAGLLRLVGKEQILRKEEQTFQLGRSLNQFDLETGQNTLPQNQRAQLSNSQ